MSKPLVLSLIARGRPEHPRFLIANQHRKFWTGHDWSHNEDEGLLFANEVDAGWACTEILTEHSKDKPVFRFVAPVEIEIRSASPPDLADIQLWLIRAASLYVDYKQSGLSDGTAILSINWKQLKEVSE